MDEFLISVDYKDPAWIAIAFGLGLLCKQVNLPPMVGFLAAGFALHLLGVRNGPFLQAIADLGITLLLFSIGLKLRLETLLRPEIWATAAAHMAATVAALSIFLMILSLTGAPLFSSLTAVTALIIAFALSFSSTVFAVKTLEDRGALVARYGQVAIGVLVLQDIAAVIFLAASTGKPPNIWAVLLPLLIPARSLARKVLDFSGHKELLTIFGFVMALGGAALFEFAGMKGDLGALIMGVLLAGHHKTNELARTLLDFKDVFLVGFFLTIGLTGLPGWETLAVALVLILLIPLKTALFFWLLTRFRLRARGATLGSLVLGNYSEFGLIVGAIAISAGWADEVWITVIAVALALSFAIASPFNTHADRIYGLCRARLKSFESKERLPGDEAIDFSGDRILVFGMGRMGRAIYDEMRSHVGPEVLGVDLDESRVVSHCEAGRKVILGDATHPEFWSRVNDGHGHVDLIVLAMPHHSANIDAARRMRKRGYEGPIIATALHADEEEDLIGSGVNEVFNVYREAGAGAAAHLRRFLPQTEQQHFGEFAGAPADASEPEPGPPREAENPESSKDAKAKA